MSIIDTHLHLIHPERLSYPWLAHVPALDNAIGEIVRQRCATRGCDL